MKNYKELTLKEAKNFKGILTDIDDTLTYKGRLIEEGYSALWRAKNAGLKVIPITGRPSGWCEMIARFWPVDGVVGENGAFYYYLENEVLKKRFIQDDKVRSSNMKKLHKIISLLLKKYPALKISSDQKSREGDISIDYCEEVPTQNLDMVNSFKEELEEKGVHVKVSSIHVNCWFGDYDKMSTTKRMFRELFDIDIEKENEKFIYFGDSPNDVPMFKYFVYSCGVGNIQKYRELLTTEPSFHTPEEGGKGTLNMIEHILKLRGSA